MVVTLADDTTTTLNVENGKGITSIAKTGASGLVDTYTITYNDATTSTFTVTNGEKGDTGDSWYVWIRYAGSEPTQDSDMGTDPDNWMGIYSGTSSTAPVHYTDYDWFEIKGEKGDQGDPSSIVSQSVTYQEGTTPNIQPSGTWTTTIPAVAQGNYLWTKTEIEFNSGSPIQFFSVARMGVDGAGSVSSVNGQSPDGTGNVTVTASDIQTTDSTSVQSDLTGLKNTLNSVETSANAIEDAIAYVQSGDTASRTYTAGQFVYLKNHPTLAEGLYTVNSGGIPSGTTVTGHLTADGTGGLNTLLENKEKVKYATYSVQLNSSSARVASSLVGIAGYKLISASIQYNSDYYYTVATDGIYMGLLLQGSGSSDDGVVLIGLNKGLATSANRTILVECVYTKV